MSYTIFGKGEPGIVRLGELFMLGAMVKKQSMNTFHYLINHFANVASSTSGDIVVGGLITYIAIKFELRENIEALDGVEGNLVLDLNVCVQMNLISVTPYFY